MKPSDFSNSTDFVTAVVFPQPGSPVRKTRHGFMLLVGKVVAFNTLTTVVVFDRSMSDLIAGVDDAGRGPIIGPLVVAGVLTMGDRAQLNRDGGEGFEIAYASAEDSVGW